MTNTIKICMGLSFLIISIGLLIGIIINGTNYGLYYKIKHSPSINCVAQNYIFKNCSIIVQMNCDNNVILNESINCQPLQCSMNQCQHVFEHTSHKHYLVSNYYVSEFEWDKMVQHEYKKESLPLLIVFSILQFIILIIVAVICVTRLISGNKFDVL